MTRQDTIWYWAGAAPVVIFGGLAVYLMLHGMSALGWLCAGIGLFLKIFITSDPTTSR